MMRMLTVKSIILTFFLCVQPFLALPLTVNNFYNAGLSSIDCNEYPSIKMVVFVTGSESPAQLALIPKVQAVAQMYGGNKLEERAMPSGGPTYASSANVPLQLSWYKMQVTREVMAENPQADWVLTFELSALPTDGSAAINFAALIEENPSTAVFLKRVGTGFGMAMYKNDPATREVVEKIWEKKSASGTVMAAFTSFTFWNPSLLTKVKFI